MEEPPTNNSKSSAGGYFAMVSSELNNSFSNGLDSSSALMTGIGASLSSLGNSLSEEAPAVRPKPRPPMSSPGGVSSFQQQQQQQQRQQQLQQQPQQQQMSKEEVNQKMEILMKNPVLWKEFQQRLKESQRGKTGAGIQAVLRDFLNEEVEAPPELANAAKNNAGGPKRAMRRLSILEVASSFAAEAKYTGEQTEKTAAMRRASMGGAAIGGGGGGGGGAHRKSSMSHGGYVGGAVGGAMRRMSAAAGVGGGMSSEINHNHQHTATGVGGADAGAGGGSGAANRLSKFGKRFALDSETAGAEPPSSSSPSVMRPLMRKGSTGDSRRELLPEISEG